jgi:hypothetical protein
MYSKQRKLPKSLTSQLMHELLLLSMKLEDYRIDIFKEYLKQPFERSLYHRV